MSGAAPQARRLDRVVGESVFGADPDGYHAGRIGYPEALYDAVKARIGRDVATALEIGPGTGLATRDILSRLSPRRLIAVEADPALAKYLSRAIMDPRLTVIGQGFLEAPLDPPMDLACSAAAFHWLELEAAFARLRALLRPAATLALWWNSYRVVGIGDDFADALAPLLEDIPLPPSEGLRGHYSLDTDLQRAAITRAGFVHFEPYLFRRDRTLDPTQVGALYASYSFVRALPPPRREALLRAIDELARERFAGEVRNVVMSALYLASAP